MFNRFRGGLLAGTIGLALAFSSQVMADPMPMPTDTTTTTTTTTSVGAPLKGYYDNMGAWHSEVSPYSTGWYDDRGLWHTTTTTTTSSVVTTTYTEPDMGDRYKTSYHNYYAGYGSMMDMNRGFVNVMGADGSMHQVSLKDDRVMVRLCEDNTLEPKLDIERGFDRGLADTTFSTFDPHLLQIHTGEHVTFYSDGGAHTIQPQDGHSLTQSVIITPGICYNWTFTEPGLYRFEDSFGGGPTQDRLQGLIIMVKGDSVAFDDSMFVDAMIPYQSLATTTTTEESTAIITPAPQVDTSVVEETTVVPQTQVLGTQPAQPAVKPQPRKKILRNQDIK